MKRCAILFLAINYRTPEKAIELASLFGRLPPDRTDIAIAFIDNSDEPDGGRLEKRLHVESPAIPCWTAPSNLGYFGGARYGLKLAKDAGADPDWVVITNVDLRCDPMQVRSALSKYDCGKIGVVAPAIRSSVTGRALNPFMVHRPSAWRMRAYKYLFRWYWGLVWYTFVSDLLGSLRGKVRSLPQTVAESPRSIYAAHGAFLALSRGLLAGASPLDHPPFLFGEEITIAESARRKGLAVIYDPGIQVIHDEHASTSIVPSRKRHRYLREASAYCADAFFS